MNGKLKTRPPGTDRSFLLCMLEDAVIHASAKVPGVPTREEVMTFLFGKTRDDPESQYLERRLARLMSQLLNEPSKKKIRWR